LQGGRMASWFGHAKHGGGPKNVVLLLLLFMPAGTAFVPAAIFCAPALGTGRCFRPNRYAPALRAPGAVGATMNEGRGGRRTGPIGRGRGPQYGQTPRWQEPDTLSMDDFMAMARKLDESEDEAAGGRRASSSAVPGRAGAPDARIGDWMCPECGVNVFASKSACFRCRAPKPAMASSESGDSERRAQKSSDFNRDEDSRNRALSVRELRERDVMASRRRSSAREKARERGEREQVGESDSERASERPRDRETERQRDRETGGEREGESESERERARDDCIHCNVHRCSSYI